MTHFVQGNLMHDLPPQSLETFLLGLHPRFEI
ncbi:hypothetical protein J802_4565, partial [Acinetobacter baumannii 45002_9]